MSSFSLTNSTSFSHLCFVRRNDGLFLLNFIWTSFCRGSCSYSINVCGFNRKAIYTHEDTLTPHTDNFKIVKQFFVRIFFYCLSFLWSIDYGTMGLFDHFYYPVGIIKYKFRFCVIFEWILRHFEIAIIHLAFIWSTFDVNCGKLNKREESNS